MCTKCHWTFANASCTGRAILKPRANAFEGSARYAESIHEKTLNDFSKRETNANRSVNYKKPKPQI